MLEDKSLGAKLSVYWPLDQKWYTGVVSGVRPVWGSCLMQHSLFCMDVLLSFNADQLVHVAVRSLF